MNLLSKFSGQKKIVIERWASEHRRKF